MRNNGFTLLEVLLAITVLGVVMSMLSISLSGTLKVVDGTEQQEEIYHQAQTALRRITEDFAAAVQTKELAFIGKKNELDGQRADTVMFPSLAHLVFNPEEQKQGVAVIHYELQADPEDVRRLKLLRSDTLLLPGKDASGKEAEESFFLLADNLRSLRLRFFNQQGQEFDDWSGIVDATSGVEAAPALPAAVSCTLEFWIDPEKEIVQTFSTGVLIPAGIVVAEDKGEN